MKMLRFAADADDVDNEAIALRAEAEALFQHEAELDALHHQDLQLQYHQQQLQEEDQRHMTFPTLKFCHKELSILKRCRQRLQLLRLRRLLRLYCLLHLRLQPLLPKRL